MSKEINVISVYVSNDDAGWIVHREDLAKKYKKELAHQLELVLKELKRIGNE